MRSKKQNKTELKAAVKPNGQQEIYRKQYIDMGLF